MPTPTRQRRSMRPDVLWAARAFRATAAGYQQLLAWLQSFGLLLVVGIEGTGAYGAGLARHLRGHHVALIEIDRPDRRTRRFAGKLGTRSTPWLPPRPPCPAARTGRPRPATAPWKPPPPLLRPPRRKPRRRRRRQPARAVGRGRNPSWCRRSRPGFDVVAAGSRDRARAEWPRQRPPRGTTRCPSRSRSTTSSGSSRSFPSCPSLTTSELHAVLSYEQTNRKRLAIISRIDALLSAAADGTREGDDECRGRGRGAAGT